MQRAAKQRMTAAEYLEFERASQMKHQFVDGEIFAMAGGSEIHSSLAVNAIIALGNRFKGKSCRVYKSDMRLKVEATEVYTYPDVHVACGGTKLEDDHCDTALNPVVIIEVLSESTAAWDRGEKFWRQANGGWLLETVEGQPGVLKLPAIDCEIPLPEIYANTGVNVDARPLAPPSQHKP